MADPYPFDRVSVIGQFRLCFILKRSDVYGADAALPRPFRDKKRIDAVAGDDPERGLSFK